MTATVYRTEKQYRQFFSDVANRQDRTMSVEAHKVLLWLVSKALLGKTVLLQLGSTSERLDVTSAELKRAIQDLERSGMIELTMCTDDAMVMRIVPDFARNQHKTPENDPVSAP